MVFVPRLTRPEAGNKYYITKSAGGWSDAIVGYPTDKLCNVLNNCVGYAYGRFNEIGKYGYCKYLRPVNAENFPEYRGDCKISQEPSLGAVLVFQKGSLSYKDGAGHVCIVEKIISSTEIVTSESGYGCQNAFWLTTRKRGANGNWGGGTAYKFRCFIENPAVTAEEKVIKTNPYSVPKITVRFGQNNQNVKWLQWELINRGYSCGIWGIDGSFGMSTYSALKKYQSEHRDTSGQPLQVDGICGPKTRGALLANPN